MKIDKLEKKDITYARDLLKKFGLPNSDIENEFLNLFSINQADQVIGIVGFEQYGKHGLLRSFVIEKDRQSKGLGAQALDVIEALANQQGIEQFYLLTTTADKFFARNDYTVFDRQAIPEAIGKTTEFNSLCPDSAVCMRKILR